MRYFAPMCGRTALIANADELREALGLDELPSLSPRYNIVPSQLLTVVRHPGKLELLRWGLVPFWAKDPKIGHKLSLARAETVQKAPAFRDAVRSRRCLVVVTGFYEWQRTGDRATPYFMRRHDEKPFTLAGIWDRWVSKDGEVVDSCAVLTQPARYPFDAIHDRMPVFLDRDVRRDWLDSGREYDVRSLLDTRNVELISFAVSTYVNDPRHDDPQCMTHAEPGQQSLFS